MKKDGKNRFWVSILIMSQLLFSVAPATAQNSSYNEKNAADAATVWAEMSIQTLHAAPQNTPTYAARILAYLGWAMYETVVGITPQKKYHSIATQLSDTLHLPQPLRKQSYCPQIALNAAQASLLKSFLGYTQRMARVDSLEQTIRQYWAKRLPQKVVERSETYGREVAKSIYEWSLHDGGHNAYERNFPKDYIQTSGIGCWSPPLFGQANTKIPMHPTWGENRTFAPQNAQLPLPAPLAYSTDSSSAYFRNYLEVWQYSQKLSFQDRQIVLWWGDDPNLTASPPAHSYHLATLAVRHSNADLLKAALTYCRVGMAVSDAFVVCWKTKFAYMVERPATFINAHFAIPSRENMYGRWYPFFPEPPFPSFYSGHATQSAATAAVLTELYGAHFSFTDDTHVQRKATWHVVDRKYVPIPYEARHFTSFWAAAQECATSRLLGGIHTRYDNDIGLQEGEKIGNNINQLWQ